jgi:hypothetical protein
MTEVSHPQTSALADIRRGIVNVAVPHNEPPSIKRRRRVVVAIVLLLGAGVLGLALRRHPGESSFYWLALALTAVSAHSPQGLCISAASAGVAATSAR